MKYFITTLIALITINTSFAKCSEKTVADINECIVDDKITMFIDYETCSWPDDTKFKDMLFANLICDPVVPLSFLETKLQDWKDINIARIVEELRIKDVTDRLKTIGIKFGKHKSVSGLREFMAKCNYEHTNPAVWIKEVFRAENVAYLECFESKKDEVDQDKKDEVTRGKNINTLRNSRDNYDCTLESGYSKILCELNKAQ